jgi:Flp pilus assembly protein CpaB
MPPTAPPEISPILSRDKKIHAGLPVKSKGNPMTIVLLIMVAILLVSGLVRSFSKPAANTDTVKVVAAAMDLPPGTKIGFSNLHYLNIPTAYYSPDMVQSYEGLVGYTTRTFIGEREPIIKSDLFPGKNGSVGMQLENDQRALTLNLDPDALVDHSVLPGDTVDVLCTSTAKDKKYTKTICQSVPVLLSVTRSALLSQKFRSEDRNRITLALTPEQCEQVAEAAEIGKIRLVLRNRLSTGTPVLSGTTESDVQPASARGPIGAVVTRDSAMALPLPPPPLAVAPPAIPDIEAAIKKPLKWVVEVFAGSSKQIYEVPKK